MSQSIYTTVRVGSNGKRLVATPERRFTTPDAATAAELAASMTLSADEQRTAAVSYNEDGVWTFKPSTGSPVHIRVVEDDATAATPDEDAYAADDAIFGPEDAEPQSTEEAAQEAAEQAEADEHEQQQLDAMGKHEESLTEQPEDPKAEAIAALFGGRPPERRCPRCAGLNGYHGSVHVRHGNGGGHNEPCPNTPAKHVPADPNAANRTRPVTTCSGCGKRIGWAVTDGDDVEAWRTPEEITDGNGHGKWCTPTLSAPESPRSECCGEPMSPENRCETCGQRGTPELQTWSDVDVVARTEQLHPTTHPYRANEVVEYVGPSGIGSWVHGPMHFRRMVEQDVAEIMTMSGPQRIEVSDLRRPASNIAVELTPDDVARLFQALAQEAERLTALGVPDTHTAELRDRFAALHP